MVGLGDLSLWAVSFDQPVPPALTEHDFDCDGLVGVGDLSWFATAWMKFVGDPTILYPPCGGGPTKRAAGLTDVEFRLVARLGRSGVDVSMIPPRSSDLCSVSAGDTFFVEVWATDAGDVNTGLTSAYADLVLPGDAISARSVSHRSAFIYFTGGSIGPDVIDELGGSALLGGQGAQPQWVRIAVVEMYAQAPASSVTFSLVPSQTGVAAYGRGLVPFSNVALDELTISGPIKPDHSRLGPRSGGLKP